MIVSVCVRHNKKQMHLLMILKRIFHLTRALSELFFIRNNLVETTSSEHQRDALSLSLMTSSLVMHRQPELGNSSSVLYVPSSLNLVDIQLNCFTRSENDGLSFGSSFQHLCRCHQMKKRVREVNVAVYNGIYNSPVICGCSDDACREGWAVAFL